MLGDLSQNFEETQYRLILTSISRSVIGELYGFTNLEYVNIFSNDQSTISFDIPKYIDGKINKTYSEIYEKRLILLKKNDIDIGYFTIEDNDENTEFENATKSIVARSEEYNLYKKKIYAIDGTYTIQELWDISFGDKAVSWSIGTIDTSLSNLHRTFDISTTSLLDLVYNYVQDSYNCVVTFDTINKEVNFLDKDGFGVNPELFISFENFQKSIGKESISGEITTRLYVYGKDDLRINSVNANGGNYLENLDYYKSDMSTSLLSTWNNYETLLDNNETTFQSYLSDLNYYNQQLTGTGDQYFENAQGGTATTVTLGANAESSNDYYNGREVFIMSGTGAGQKRAITDYSGSSKVATVDANWDTIPDTTSQLYVRELIGINYELTFLNLEMLEIQTRKDAHISTGVEYSSINAEEDSKQIQIDSKQLEKDTINSSIDTTYGLISSLSVALSKESNFSELQLKELDAYIFEDDYKDEGYYVSTLSVFEESQAVKNELKIAAEKKLEVLSVPRFSTEIELVDILTIFEGQNQRDKLENGNIVVIEYGDGVTLNARIVAITHKPDSQDLSIILSNSYSLDDDTFSFYDKDRKYNTSSTNNSYERDSYNYYLKNDAEAVQTFIGSDIDAGNNAIISTLGTQEVTIDERGIWLREIDETDPTGYKPDQLRLLSNVIAFSTDGFETSELALTAYGINVTESQIQNAIEGIDLFVPTIQTVTNITNVLYATDGNISRLTVDHLLTGSPVEGTETINYIDIKDQTMQFCTGSRRDDLPQIQYTTDDGDLIYWLNDPVTTNADSNTTTTTDTGYPFMVYQYDVLVKAEYSFFYDDVSGEYVPKISLGAGSGPDDYGKAFIYKGTDGLVLEYFSSIDGSERSISLLDSGITFTPDIGSGGGSSIYDMTELPIDFSPYEDGAIIAITS